MATGLEIEEELHKARLHDSFALSSHE